MTGPVAKAIYRPMDLWCDAGHHVEPRTYRCDGCAHRVCTRHSRWRRLPKPARDQRLCDDCDRKGAPHG